MPHLCRTGGNCQQYAAVLARAVRNTVVQTVDDRTGRHGGVYVAQRLGANAASQTRSGVYAIPVGTNTAGLIAYLDVTCITANCGPPSGAADFSVPDFRKIFFPRNPLIPNANPAGSFPPAP